MCTETWLWLTVLGVAGGAYLIGSINCALIISKVQGLKSPLEHGSGNPGATNMLRIHRNRLPAIVTLIGDAGKGALAVGLAGMLCATYDNQLMWLAAVSVVLGHIYSLYHGFKGGKGVATLAGSLAVVSWPLLGMWVVTWLVAYGIYRLVSVASIAGAAALPLYAWAVHGSVGFIVASGVLALLIVLRHKDNIERLMRGEEGSS